MKRQAWLAVLLCFSPAAHADAPPGEPASSEASFTPTDDLVTLGPGSEAVIPVLDNDGAAAARVQGCGPTRHGALDCSDGRVLRFRPDPGFRGALTVGYSVRSADWREGQAAVRLNVVDEPAAVVFADHYTVRPDTPTWLEPAANDRVAAWATPRVEIRTRSTEYETSVDDRSGRVRFHPRLGLRGRTTFAYRLVDEARGFTSPLAVATVDVLEGAGESPVAVADVAVLRAGETHAVPVLENDRDRAGAGLLLGHWDAASKAGGLVEEGSAGSLLYTPPDGFTGLDEWTYFAVDAAGRTSNRTLVMVSLEADEAPIAANDVAQVLEDTPQSIDVLANDRDPEGLPLSVVSFTAPFRGAAEIEAGGTLRYVPAPDHSGVDFFTYTAADPAGHTATARVTVIIQAVDDPPVAVDDFASTDEELGVSIPVLANDSDPERALLNLISVGPAASGSPRLEADQTITYTPNLDFFGVDSFTYTVSDGALSSTATVTVQVANRPDAPVAASDTASTVEQTPVVLDVLANDVDPDRGQLRITGLVQGQGGVAEVLPEGAVRFTPSPGFVGPAFFEYRIANDSGLEDGALASIDVTPDGTPFAVDDAATTDEDQAVRIDVLANDWDPAGDVLSLVSVSPAASGSPRLEFDADLYATIVYEPNPDFFGVDLFSYTISDGSSSAEATVTVTVRPLPDFPQAVDDLRTVAYETPAVVDALANDRDPDGGALQIIAFSPPAGEVELLPDQTFLYRPPPLFVGEDHFFYTVRSSGGMEATASVRLNVVPNVGPSPSSP